MSSQISIDKKLIKYLERTGYRSDEIIDQLVEETLTLGSIARMQIAPEQGQFLEIIVNISNSIKCLELGRFTGLSSLCIAKGLPKRGKLVAVDNSDEFLHIAKKYWKLEINQNKKFDLEEFNYNFKCRPLVKSFLDLLVIGLFRIWSIFIKSIKKVQNLI